MEAIANKLSWRRIRAWLRGDEGRRLLTCLAVSFAWGLIAHAFALLNPTLSHDSLYIYADAGEEAWKISLGRIFVPLYRQLLRGPLELPWVIGLLSFLWIGLALWLLCRLFDLRSLPMIALTGGVLSVNLTVIAQIGTYLYEMDFDMFALLMAVLGVWLWRRNLDRGWRVLLAALPVTVAVGIYQSYISVSIVLAMIACMLDLLRGTPVKAVLINGLKAVGVILLGGALYFLLLKLVTLLGGVALSSGGYNSLDNALKASDMSLSRRIRYTWLKSGIHYMTDTPVTVGSEGLMLAVNGLFWLCGGLAVLEAMLSRKLRIGAKLLFAALGLLLPFGANVAYFLNRDVHMLMLYAIWLVYLLVLLVLRWWAQAESRASRALRLWTRNLGALLLAVILCSNVLTANGVYMKKTLEREATLSLMTRVADQLEETEGYIAGETPVAILGTNVARDTLPGFEALTEVTGASHALQITHRNSVNNYFTYVLNLPINLVSSEETLALEASEAVQAMPVFPARGSIADMDGVLAVKLG